MKKLLLTLVLIIASIASIYAQKIDFQEGGISFSISVYGTLTYSIPAGKQIFNNADNTVSRIGDTYVFYSNGTVSKVGTLHIFYSGGKVSKVGGMSIFYDGSGNISQTIGAVGGSSAASSSGGGFVQTPSKTTTPIYISDVTFEDKEDKEDAARTARAIGYYLDDKSKLEKEYDTLDKNVKFVSGWYKVKVDDGDFIWTKYAYIKEGNKIVAVKDYKESVVQLIVAVGSIQKRKGYYKEYKVELSLDKAKSTYAKDKVYTVYFMSREGAAFEINIHEEYANSISFASKDKKVLKGKISFHVFAKKLTDPSYKYAYIGTVDNNQSANFIAPNDTYEVLFIVREKDKNGWYISYTLKSTYTIKQGEQKVNLTF